MKQFGLIGKSLKHSFSQSYFTEKFNRHNLNDYKYTNFELHTLDEFETLVKKTEDLCGLNVTYPYKTEIIPYLSAIDEEAKKIGAVNTIAFNGKKLVGFNTDIIGFKQSIKPFFESKHSRALIFGTGGASKAIAYGLKQMEIPFYFVSRNPTKHNELSYLDLDSKNLTSFRFLINCTPVGTFPNTNDFLDIPYDGIGKDHLVYDLIYNPAETVLLKKAKMNGAIVVNGLSMLRLQAEASWKIWDKFM